MKPITMTSHGLIFLIISLMIVVGGLTRLTDSGLSITQWQLFSGIFPPLNNDQWNHYFDLYKEPKHSQMCNLYSGSSV